MMGMNDVRPPDALVQYLIAQRCLPEGYRAADAFPGFERDLVAHIGADSDRIAGAVMFDCETIEHPQSYQLLLDQFVRAYKGADPFEQAQARYDVDADTVECTVVKRKRTHTARWTQRGSDWVDPAFLAFAFEVTRAPNGQFIEIDTGDQTFLALWLDADPFKAFEQYRARSKASRQEFLTGYSSAMKDRFRDIAILPRALYRQALRAFDAAHLAAGGMATAPRIEHAPQLSARLVEESADALRTYREVNRELGDETRYLPFSRFEIDALCPPGECLFLSLRDPGQEVVFRVDVAHVGANIIGDHEEDLGDYLLLGLAGDWALRVCNDNDVLAVGAPVVEIASAHLRDIAANRAATRYMAYCRQRLVPMMERHGFHTHAQRIEFCWAELPSHGAAAIVAATQAAADAPIMVEITFAQHLPRLMRWHDEERAERAPRTRSDYAIAFPADSVGRWQIDPDQDCTRVFDAIDAYLQRHLPLLVAVPDLEALLPRLLADGDYALAAAAAAELDRREQAIELARLHLARIKDGHDHRGERQPAVTLLNHLGVAIGEGVAL
jgi:hypothetical protein